MSLNKLVGSDCGGNNSLVKLSNIVSRDASISQQISQSDRLVNEFLAQNTQVPQTFNMNTLLNSVHEVESSKQQTIPHLNPNQMRTVSSNIHSPWLPGPSSSYMPPTGMLHTFQAPFPSSSRQQMLPNVSIQYMDESEFKNVKDSDVRAKAQEYIETVDDEQAYNQFMSFMKRISAGELNLGESDQDQRTMGKDKIIDEMAEKYKDEWAKLSDMTGDWKLSNSDGIPEEYTFTDGNVMLENKSAFELGKEKLKMGDIPGAVLCFEAAVQQQPESAEAWFYLGTTQAENEQDPLAITALKKSLSIDPRQLEAYITLAAAYTNEDMPKFAFVALSNWLNASPKYSDLLPRDVEIQNLDLKELENHVKSLYLRAAQLNPSEIDPDVQNALGVIFNISQEYDKAVDCFKTALMVSNENAKLWNRLGATLANSNRSEEAVNAYHEALNLEPGFIRARYNVGVTCMNLGAHKQAAEHFLVALNQQNKAKNLHQDTSTSNIGSSTIWSTLRMVCSFMGNHEAASLVDDRKLDELNKHFELDA
ncbi:PREDICTED: peroxisomal targeting signal 1 receptor [Papilio xuthus]|uniref:Peroxisomal targeting signal 1 receptor n=1 Tax=Papilio xuthus TaxID=66420 RepID=A0AAJ6ZWZ1_PAPXU|nr:PREDICTED: peroxisomal targeting signal 1 receptor [Papilio xuthus]